MFIGMPIGALADWPVAPGCSSRVLKVGHDSQMGWIHTSAVLAGVVDGLPGGDLLPAVVNPCGTMCGRHLSAAQGSAMPTDLGVSMRRNRVGADPATIDDLISGRSTFCCPSGNQNWALWHPPPVRWRAARTDWHRHHHFRCRRRPRAHSPTDPQRARYQSMRDETTRHLGWPWSPSPSHTATTAQPRRPPVR